MSTADSASRTSPSTTSAASKIVHPHSAPANELVEDADLESSNASTAKAPVHWTLSTPKGEGEEEEGEKEEQKEREEGE